MILLDTHVLLWLRIGDARLGPTARQVIARAENEGEVAVSAISFWEVAMLQDKGRIELDEDVGSWRRLVLDQGIVEIAINGEIGIRADSNTGPASQFPFGQFISRIDRAISGPLVSSMKWPPSG